MATVSAADRRRARVVAEAVLADAAAAGVEPPPGLALWELAGDGVDSVAAGDGSGQPLASVLEQATPADQRQVNGLHVTPAWLAADIVERVLDGLAGDGDADGHAGSAAVPALSVCDPACGGGAFLLAWARALHDRGIDRRTIVRELVWGADVDRVGLATAEAALALWAGEPPPPGRLVVGDALARGRQLWPGAQPFAAVVGNPPFLNQLGRATTRSAAAAARLRERFGEAVQPYTDAAWLFLLLGCDLVRPGGRVALVEPLSLVAARDARPVRSELHRRARLRDLWVDDGSAFAASVTVCAPVLEVGTGGDDTAAADRVWADRLADAIGVPPVDLGAAGGPVLGDVAEVTAGFRDEYYGLVPLVREASPDRGDAMSLVTAGVLDWGLCRWGERPTRFAKQAWQAPVVDVELAPEEQTGVVRAGLRWVERHRCPKILVASQTRVVEAAVDEEAAWVPSVPVVSVVPQDPADLWRLAAAISSPAATAWLFRRAPGTALGKGALKIAAGDLAALPLPPDRDSWQQAASALRAYACEAPTSAHQAHFAHAATAMYGSSPDLLAWWQSRLDPPQAPTRPGRSRT
jgi:hypothetical protein